jgi:hypothetical protein
MQPNWKIVTIKNIEESRWREPIEKESTEQHVRQGCLIKTIEFYSSRKRAPRDGN